MSGIAGWVQLGSYGYNRYGGVGACQLADQRSRANCTSRSWLDILEASPQIPTQTAALPPRSYLSNCTRLSAHSETSEGSPSPRTFWRQRTGGGRKRWRGLGESTYLAGCAYAYRARRRVGVMQDEGGMIWCKTPGRVPISESQTDSRARPLRTIPALAKLAENCRRPAAFSTPP
ncbi:hypothetical protein PYCCODRAFT_222451 [Trametes coccinea BRFM310]|uniref:Uncharacterized protein n=1 Tax=Trametes coccinea (strain BRFM310) TaxID=1353009 RepID=A0A1Y2IQW8_TRAC3|nr:hypothetical protein PYCCODRAFT_222451 [Trametes coccinea BRFM310]